MRNTVRTALLVAMLALGLRGALLPVVAQEPARMFRRDARSYVRPALNLLEGRGLSQEDHAPYTPDAFRTPAYPAFIALLYAVFGARPLAIAAAQVLLNSAAAALTYLLARKLLPEKEARWSALLFAISLGPIVYSLTILTETLFTTLLLLTTFALAGYRRTGDIKWLGGGGATIGAAILCRPIALLFPVVAAPAFACARPGKWHQKAKTGLILIAVVGIVVAPWMARNQRVVGSFTPSTVGSYNLLFYNAVSLQAWMEGRGAAEVREQMKERVEDELRARGDLRDKSVRVQVYRQLALDIISAHPWRYAYVHLKSDLNSLLPNVTEFLEILGVTRGGKGTLSVLNQEGVLSAVHHYFGNRTWALWLVLPWMAILALTYLGAVVGTVVLARRGHWFTLVLALLPSLYFLLLPGAPSHPRFRVPVMPYLCLLAGTGLVATWNWTTGLLEVRTGA